LDVTVGVATFGDPEWIALAEERALPSARALGVEVIYFHGKTLVDARNSLLEKVTTEFICVLDADDELERHYFDHIAKSAADIRVPSVRYVKNGFDQGVRMPRVVNHDHDCTPECLAYGNWLVIGSVAPTALLKSLGGFRDYPVYEDYEIWLRCWKAGATIEACPRAVYRAHVRTDSRNRGQLSQREKHATHQAIAREHGVPVPA
jgi:glycosyltransferase involved in cell wall biosynthesis